MRCNVGSEYYRNELELYLAKLFLEVIYRQYSIYCGYLEVDSTELEANVDG